MKMNIYDLIILGAGPAGMSASIYASRYKINHIIIGNIFDGSVVKAHLIENWLGEKSIKGTDLMMKFNDHIKDFGTNLIVEDIVEIKEEENVEFGRNVFNIKTNNNKTYRSKSILIALGTKHRKLNIFGEEELLGKGVSYCAVCDGAFFKNKIVAVVGGSNSAAMASIMLSEHADKVYLIYRKKPLRCEPIMTDRIKENKKITILYNTNVTKVLGENRVKSIELDNEYDSSKEIKLDGLFIEAGSVPSASLVKELNVNVNDSGYIIINSNGATNIEGVYAAGDITNGSNGLRQIVTAVSEGAISATSIYKYLKEK